MPTTCPRTNACLRVIVSGDFGAGIEARAGDVCSLAYIGGNWGTRRSYKWAYGRKFGRGGHRQRVSMQTGFVRAS